MKNERLLIVYILIFIAGIISVGYLVIGFTAVLFSGTFVGGFILWVATTYRTPVDPDKIIVPYLLTVILFMVHVYEEYLTHIEQFFAQVSGLPVSQEGVLTIAAFLGPLTWLTGALLIIKRWYIGYFFVSTFLAGMMFAEPLHFIFPLMEDGSFHYSPGMYTALLPAISGWYTFRIILREIKKERNALISSGSRS